MAQKKAKQKLSKPDKEFLSKQADGIYAKIETNRGDIYSLLDFKQFPNTVANFVGLAEGTITNTAKPASTPYYDGLKFHRIIPGFMIQGGCPVGNGSGNPGYSFNDELNAASELGKKGYLRGTLAMANAGPNTNGSQFFIMHKDYPLPYSYSIFGQVVQGIEVVDSIVNAPRDAGDRPNQDQIIKHITILRKGKEAAAFDAAKTFESKEIGWKKKTEKLNSSPVVTSSGLKYVIEKEGTGAMPSATSNVTVHYTGYFVDGRVFDSSVSRGQPATFGLNQVIKGWTEGVQLMKEGAKYTFLIPYNLAYGEEGRSGIPPKSDLIFEIELIKVN
ncbi:MAG: peptidylprolyl isomerase [Bacteroidetes bacterium]|nr:peptidylprolyl isomerase [Bacteroidota bacterium]